MAAGLFVAVMAAGLTADALIAGPAFAQTGGAVPGQALGSTSDAELWRRLRRGEAFVISDPRTGTPIVIQSAGEEWRSFRNGPLSFYGGWLVAATVAAVAAFFLIKGRIKIDGGRSGRWLLRFSNAERVIHWYVAAVFVILAFSGLIILFGKAVVMPVVGKEAFAVIASASLQSHNLFGPLFIVGIAAMIAVYLKDNFLKAADIQWMLKGGLLSRAHPPSWKYNFGEKAWFWLAAITGITLSLSGIVLDFPSFFSDRDDLQLANLFHAGAAVIVIAAGLAHIYLGVIGVEGALEGMTAGRVDENWAVQHHDLWAAEVMDEQEPGRPETDARPDGAPGAPAE